MAAGKPARAADRIRGPEAFSDWTERGIFGRADNSRPNRENEVVIVPGGVAGEPVIADARWPSAGAVSVAAGAVGGYRLTDRCAGVAQG